MFSVKHMVRKPDGFVRELMAESCLEAPQDPRHSVLRLGYANDGAEEDGREDPEV